MAVDLSEVERGYKPLNELDVERTADVLGWELLRAHTDPLIFTGKKAEPDFKELISPEKLVMHLEPSKGEVTFGELKGGFRLGPLRIDAVTLNPVGPDNTKLKLEGPKVKVYIQSDSERTRLEAWFGGEGPVLWDPYGD